MTTPPRTLVVVVLFLGALGAPEYAKPQASLEAARVALKQGEALLAAGGYAEASDSFRTMMAHCGENRSCLSVASFYLGRCAFETGAFETGREMTARARDMFAALREATRLGKALHLLGRIEEASGNPEHALELYDEAARTLTDAAPYDDRELFDIELNRANTHVLLCKYDQAEKDLSAAERLIGRGLDRDGRLALLKERKGLICFQQQQYDSALQFYREALDLHETNHNTVGVSVVCNAIGQIYLAQTKFAEAEAQFQKALEAGPDSSVERASAYNSLGGLHLRRGDYARAAGMYEEALKLAEQRRAERLISDILNNIGLVWLKQGNYTKALELFSASYSRAESGGSLGSQPWALHDMALVRKDQGRFSDALGLSTRAVHIARRIRNRRIEATALLRLGNLYEYYGDFARAVENYRAAAKLQEQIGDRLFLSNTLTDLALASTRSGHIEEADTGFGEALRIRREIGAPLGEALCKRALFFIEKESFRPTAPLREDRAGDLDRARQALTEAESTIRPEDGHDAMLLLYSKGRLLLETSPAAAEAEFLALKNKADSSGSSKYSFLAFVGLGLAYERADRLSEAARAFQEAVNYAEKIRELLDPAARVNFFHGEEILGIKHAAPYEGLARTLMKRGEIEKSLAASEGGKARVFSEKLAQRQGTGPAFSVDQGLLDRLELIEREMASIGRRLASRSSEKGDMTRVVGLHARVDQLKEEWAEVKRELRERFPSFYKVRFPEHGLPEPDVSALRTDEIAVEYEVTDFGLCVFLMKDRKVAATFFKDAPRFEVERLIRRFRGAFEKLSDCAQECEGAREFAGCVDDCHYDKLSSFDLAAGERLAELLLADVTALIPPGRPLILIPDDCLGVLPFEMLPLNSEALIKKSGDFPAVTGAEFLGDRNPVTYSHSLTALNTARSAADRKSPKERLLVFADPVFDMKDKRAQAVSGMRVTRADDVLPASLMIAVQDATMDALRFDPLPVTGTLAKHLCEMYRGQSEAVTGLEARKEFLLSEVAPRIDDFGMLVFATHGYYGGEGPLRDPLLVLTMVPPGADGWLTMGEVMGLKLNADIVALTACKTGLGPQIRGEGAMSMGRAFQYAGARSVLMSLWSVDAFSSVKLIEGFFRLRKEGKSKSESLRLARKALREEGFEHPFFWASFVLAGEPD
jgi:tetratricopeptide (TPR) repeat protein